MLLTQWALPQVLIASFQNNASCGCRGNDEEIEIFGAFQNAAEARAAVDSKKERTEDLLAGRDFHNFVADCGVDRVSLRVQKVPNVPASKPMTLLALVKSFRDTLVWLQLCNPQGAPMFSFVQVLPRVSRPFAGSRVYDMLLTHA